MNFCSLGLLFLKRLWKLELFLILWLIPSYLLVKQIYVILETRACFEMTGDSIVCKDILNDTKRIANNCTRFSATNFHSMALNVKDHYARHHIPTNETIYLKKSTTITITPVTRMPEEINDKHFCDIATKSDITIKILSKRYENITIAIKLLVILVAGAWIDRYHSLKWIMFMSLVGQSLGIIIILLIDEFEDIPLETMYASSVMVRAVSGDKELMIVGIHIYLALATSETDRTFRFAFIPLFSTELIGDIINRVDPFEYYFEDFEWRSKFV